MMQLHERLRQFRLGSGMTQAEVAEKLYVTRQTVSSYESGRTQPDVETLARLAEVYSVSVQELLDFDKLERRDYRKTEWFLWGTELWILFCCMAQAALFLTVNHLYVVPEGQVPQTMIPVLEMRIALLDAAAWVEYALLGGGWLLGIVLLVQSVQGMLPPKRLWLNVGSLAAAMLLTALLGAATDPLYGFVNYWHVSKIVLIRAVLFLLLGLAGKWLAAKRKR